jgi:hypothetical protein
MKHKHRYRHQIRHEHCIQLLINFTFIKILYNKNEKQGGDLINKRESINIFLKVTHIILEVG